MVPLAVTIRTCRLPTALAVYACRNSSAATGRAVFRYNTILAVFARNIPRMLGIFTVKEIASVADIVAGTRTTVTRCISVASLRHTIEKIRMKSTAVTGVARSHRSIII